MLPGAPTPCIPSTRAESAPPGPAPASAPQLPHAQGRAPLRPPAAAGPGGAHLPPRAALAQHPGPGPRPRLRPLLPGRQHQPRGHAPHRPALVRGAGAQGAGRRGVGGAGGAAGAAVWRGGDVQRRHPPRPPRARIRQALEAGGSWTGWQPAAGRRLPLPAWRQQHARPCRPCGPPPPGSTSCALNIARPPGWCIFNDQAVAARAAQRDAGIGQVLFVDLDVHQVGRRACGGTPPPSLATNHACPSTAELREQDETCALVSCAAPCFLAAYVER